MKRIIFLLIIFLFPNFLTAQAIIEWSQNYGGNESDILQSLEKTNDGGFLLVGTSYYSLENDGVYDCLVIKTDSLGNIEWSQNYGGGLNESGVSVVTTNDEGFLIAGVQSDEYDSNSGDYWLLKIDSLGNIEWNQTYGGNKWDELKGLNQTIDGGFILVGYSASDNGDLSDNNGSTDFWVLKIDSIGNIEWSQNYGGNCIDEATSVTKTNDGGFLVGGWSCSDDGDVGTNNGTDDYWVLKIDGLGNIDWSRNYGGSGSERLETVISTNDGGFLLGGGSNSVDGDINSNNGDLDFWVLKIDGLGNIEWSQNYGGSELEYIEELIETSDGGFLLGGMSNSNDGDVSANNGNNDYWIVKINELGTIEWEQNYGGSNDEQLYSLLEISEGYFLLGGYSNSNDGDVVNSNDLDFWVIKINEMLLSTEIKMIALSNDFSFYPNPTTGKFTINNESKTIQTIIVHDIMGKLIHEQRTNVTQINVNIDVESGIYLLSLETKEGMFYKKIIIQ